MMIYILLILIFAVGLSSLIVAIWKRIKSGEKTSIDENIGLVLYIAQPFLWAFFVWFGLKFIDLRKFHFFFGIMFIMLCFGISALLIILLQKYIDDNQERKHRK